MTLVSAIQYIAHLDVAVRVEQDIGALDVAVHDTMFVQIVETLQDLQRAQACMRMDERGMLPAY